MTDAPSSLFGLSQRLPPSNVQAEQSLLGAILANNSAYERVSGFLRPEHFADPLHAWLYGECAKLIDGGRLADAVVLKSMLENAAQWELYGMPSTYLAQLLTAMVGILNAGEYGRAVFECYLRRQMVSLGEEMINAGFGDGDAGCAAPDLIAAAQDRLAALAEEGDSGTTAKGPKTTIANAVASAIERAEAMHRGEEAPGLSTGIPAIDNAYGRFLQPATLNYLAGLGEVGKTTLALQIAENVARDAMERWQRGGQQGPCPGVLFFSFDMTEKQIGARSAARLGGLSVKTVRSGDLRGDVPLALMRAQDAANALPLEIDDGEPPSLGRVIQVTRRFVRRRPAVLIVVDNLSKLIGEGKLGDALFPAFLNTTNALKKLANRLGVPIVLLVHLPQTVAKRDNPQPRRGDLPYGIHLHADTALGLWRPELALSPQPPEMGRLKEEFWLKLRDQWHKRKEALRDVAEIVPLKLREDEGGGVIKLRYDQATSSFVDPAASSEPPADL